MYTVIEMQTNGSSMTVVTPIKTFADKGKAHQEFHTVAAYAAVSKVQTHTVILLNEYGNIEKREIYEHEQEEE